MTRRIRQRKSNWQWYGVKVLFECIISGSPTPEYVDENYTNNHKTYEESIILVKASSFENAYIIAEKKAKDIEHEYYNLYDELVEWRYVEALDCFVLNDNLLITGTELYSRFLHVPKNISTDEVINHYYPETVEEHVVDYNFILRNKDFNARPDSKEEGE